MSKFFLLSIAFVLLSFLGCQENETASDKLADLPLKGQSVKYAQGFSIQEFENYTLLTVNGAWRGENNSYQYALYKDEAPEGLNNAIKVKVPISSITCMSLTHLAFLDRLGLLDKLVAVSGAQYSSNASLHALIKAEKVVEIGSSQTINYELLVEQDPDLIMAYGINEDSEKYITKLKSLGLTTVLNAEYMEVHPLGKTEWIKFVAAFFDELDKAEQLFKEIEKEYLNLLELTSSIQDKPTVFVGMPWKGSWYVAGGKSFQAQLFKDAGADYIWANNDEKSSVVKSKEVVFDQAFTTDYWLNVNSYESVGAIVAHDAILKNFNAIAAGQVYNNSKRLNANAGNDYWETGTVEPHIVLKDMIEIFHPKLLDHELKYYKNLE